jgi:hypothetical protein
LRDGPFSSVMKLFDLIAIKAAMASRVIEGACVWSGSSRLTRKRYLAPLSVDDQEG